MITFSVHTFKTPARPLTREAHRLASLHLMLCVLNAPILEGAFRDAGLIP